MVEGWSCLRGSSDPYSQNISTAIYSDSRLFLSPFKIIFYEGRNFQGRHWECNTDCMDTFRHFNCCNSIRVSGGHWVAYEKPFYMGYQYILGPGEYPDYHSWMGFNNCVRSCQMLSPVSQSKRQIGLVVPPPCPLLTLYIKKCFRNSCQSWAFWCHLQIRRQFIA